MTRTLTKNEVKLIVRRKKSSGKLQARLQYIEKASHVCVCVCVAGLRSRYGFSLFQNPKKHGRRPLCVQLFGLPHSVTRVCFIVGNESGNNGSCMRKLTSRYDTKNVHKSTRECTECYEGTILVSSEILFQITEFL